MWNGKSCDRCLYSGAHTHCTVCNQSCYRYILFQFKNQLSIMGWLYHSSFHCCHCCWFFSFSGMFCLAPVHCWWESRVQCLKNTTHTTFYIENQKNGWAPKRSAKNRATNTCGRARWSLVNEHSTHEVLIVFASSPLLILFVSTK